MRWDALHSCNLVYAQWMAERKAYPRVLSHAGKWGSLVLPVLGVSKPVAPSVARVRSGSAAAFIGLVDVRTDERYELHKSGRAFVWCRKWVWDPAPMFYDAGVGQVLVDYTDTNGTGLSSLRETCEAGAVAIGEETWFEVASPTFRDWRFCRRID